MIKITKKMPPMPSKFPTWLNDKMNERGWTQSDLSRESKLSRQTISYWMSGNAKRPDEFSLQKVAKAFGVPAEEAYEAAAIMPPSSKEDAWTREMMHKLNQLSGAQRKIAEWMIKKLAEDEENNR